MKRGLVERLRRRPYSAVERTGIFCLGLLMGAHLVLRGSWAPPPPPSGSWVSSTTLIACSMMLYSAPGFLVGALVGALFLRVHTVRYSWRGAALALLAGALFPLVAYCLEEWRPVPLLMWTLVLAYPLATGLATSFFRLRRADLTRLRDAISHLDLPRELSMFVRKVARQTRLWKREQIVVVRELAERFADGLTAGRTSRDLVAEFGDLDQAVRHLRHVRMRQRPLAWRIWHRSVQTALWMLTIGIWWYTYLFLAFNLADSTPVVHLTPFTAENTGDVEERAWPHYSAGLERLEAAGVDEHRDGILSLRPDEPGWSEVAGFLAENQEAIYQFREGAGRPRLGFDAGDPRNVRDIEESGAHSDVAFLTTELMSVAQLLFADFRRAVDADDDIVAAADFEALFFLSRQCRSLRGGLSFALTSYFDHVSHADLGRTLLEKPTLFPEERLAEWARVMGSGSETPAEFSDRLRAVLRDRLSSLYAAEGQPRERLPPAAIGTLLGNERKTKTETWESDSESWRAFVLKGRLVGPVISAVILDRSAMGERGDELLDEVEDYVQTPLWRRGPSPLATWLQRIEASRFQTARLLPLVSFCRGFDWIVEHASLRSQRRDAAVVAIALARFHVRNGAWPRSLAELVPALLPEVPVDVFDGQPIRYRRLGSGPIIYSVGPDRVDDGGVPLSDPWSQFDLLGVPNLPPGTVGRDWLLLPAVDAELR